MTSKAAVLALWSAATLGCAAEQRSAPVVGPFVPANAQVARGERVFFTFCHQCHPGGQAGLGPGMNDKPLPRFAVRTQIRAGVGAMPSFSEQEIPAGDLDAVVEYVVALREHGR